MVTTATTISDFLEYGGKFLILRWFIPPEIATVIPSSILVGNTHWFKWNLIGRYYQPTGSILLGNKRFARTFLWFGKTTTGNRRRNAFYCAGLVISNSNWSLLIFIINKYDNHAPLFFIAMWFSVRDPSSMFFFVILFTCLLPYQIMSSTDLLLQHRRIKDWKPILTPPLSINQTGVSSTERALPYLLQTTYMYIKAENMMRPLPRNFSLVIKCFT